MTEAVCGVEELLARPVIARMPEGLPEEQLDPVHEQAAIVIASEPRRAPVNEVVARSIPNP
jgi:hypothetical protein